MAEHVKAWQCIGCGSIEAPQTCIGVCEHRKVEFVYASEHEATRAELQRTSDALHALEALAHQLAHTTPHDNGFKASYLALQRRARELLAPGEQIPTAGVSTPARRTSSTKPAAPAKAAAT